MQQQRGTPAEREAGRTRILQDELAGEQRALRAATDPQEVTRLTQSIKMLETELGGQQGAAAPAAARGLPTNAPMGSRMFVQTKSGRVQAEFVGKSDDYPTGWRKVAPQ